MQTRLVFNNSEKNLKLLLSQLKKKYKSFEELSMDVQKEQCGMPNKVDDFMTWQAINSFEKEKEVLSKLPNNSGMDTTLTCREEIFFYTSEFFQVLTPRRIELLEYISSHNPGSLKILAEEIGRDYKNVYDDAKALQEFKLLELVREGKNKRPISRITAFEVMIKNM